MMRKLTILAATALACSFSAMAGTVTLYCTPMPGSIPLGNTPGASGNLTAPGFSCAGAGLTGILDISSVSISIIGTFDGGATGTDQVLETFTPTAPSGFSWATNPQVTVVGSSTNSSCLGTANPCPATESITGSLGPGNASVSLADFNAPATAFNVGMSALVQSGNVYDATGTVQVTYTYDTSAPEPVSMLLFGSGLLAVSLISRKRFSSK